LSSDSDLDSAEDGMSSDDSLSTSDTPTPSDGPFGTLSNAFLSGPGHNGYDCNHHYQVRSDILTVLDQSPWFYDSFCYIFTAASLGQDPYLSSSTSSFLGLSPYNPIGTAPVGFSGGASNVHGQLSGGVPLRRLDEVENSRYDEVDFTYMDFVYTEPGQPDMCRQLPLYADVQGSIQGQKVGLHAEIAASLCFIGTNLRADSSWVIAMLTMNGPMKCCIDFAMRSEGDISEGSELE